MTNHPGRTKPDLSGLILRPVTPAELIELRTRAGLSQTLAGTLVHAPLRTWQRWEADSDTPAARRMPMAAMELWCLALAVGTLGRGPYLAPGDWMLPFVRPELCTLLQHSKNPVEFQK